MMCGINLIFAIISNFGLYFSIVRLQFVFAINSRLRGTNFIRTTYSELIRFSFLEVWTVDGDGAMHMVQISKIHNALHPLISYLPAPYY